MRRSVIVLVLILIFAFPLYSYKILLWKIGSNREENYAVIDTTINSGDIQTTITDELPDLTQLSYYDALLIIVNDGNGAWYEIINKEDREKINDYLYLFNGNLFFQYRYVFNFIENWWDSLYNDISFSYVDVKRYYSKGFSNFLNDNVYLNGIYSVCQSPDGAKDILSIDSNVLAFYFMKHTYTGDMRIVLSSADIFDYGILKKLRYLFGDYNRMYIGNWYGKIDTVISLDTIYSDDSLFDNVDLLLVGDFVFYNDSVKAVFERFYDDTVDILFTWDNPFVDSILSVYSDTLVMPDTLFFDDTFVTTGNINKIGTNKEDVHTIPFEDKKGNLWDVIFYKITDKGNLICYTPFKDLANFIMKKVYYMEPVKSRKGIVDYTISMEKDGIKIEWEEEKDHTYMYLIHRIDENGNDVVINTVKKDDLKKLVFIDRYVKENEKYIYYISRITTEGKIERITPDIEVTYIPPHIELPYKIFTNPFASYFYMSYTVSKESNVDISVYDISGKKVKTLDSGVKSEGTYSVEWDCRDNKGNIVTRNIYFLLIKIGNDVYKVPVTKVD